MERPQFRNLNLYPFRNPEGKQFLPYMQLLCNSISMNNTKKNLAPWMQRCHIENVQHKCQFGQWSQND
eukprot:m.131459 g.131459  ORF g.131459 m.131459 type:complete len:68 (+) comp29549_c0_seq1:824-1027(+)